MQEIVKTVNANTKRECLNKPFIKVVNARFGLTRQMSNHFKAKNKLLIAHKNIAIIFNKSFIAFDKTLIPDSVIFI